MKILSEDIMDGEIVTEIMDPEQIKECIFRNLPNNCGPPKESMLWSKLFEGYLALFVSVFGVFGNSISFVVLLDAPFLDLFNKLLVSLSVCDIVFLGKKNCYYKRSKECVFNIYIPNIHYVTLIATAISFFSCWSAREPSKSIYRE